MRILLLLLLTSCAVKQLTPAGSAVMTRMPSFKKCSEVASFVAKGSSLKDVYIDAKNKSAELGGNYIDVDVPRSDLMNFSTNGIAYYCR